MGRSPPRPRPERTVSWIHFAGHVAGQRFPLEAAVPLGAVAQESNGEIQLIRRLLGWFADLGNDKFRQPGLVRFYHGGHGAQMLAAHHRRSPGPAPLGLMGGGQRFVNLGVSRAADARQDLLVRRVEHLDNVNRRPAPRTANIQRNSGHYAVYINRHSHPLRFWYKSFSLLGHRDTCIAAWQARAGGLINCGRYFNPSLGHFSPPSIPARATIHRSAGLPSRLHVMAFHLH